MTSPTRLTLNHLRATYPGALVQVVEHWNAFARIRQDLFGIFDILLVCGNEVVGIQCTSASNISARVKKMRSSPALSIWLASDTRKAIVIGWRKNGRRWERKTVNLDPNWNSAMQ